MPDSYVHIIAGLAVFSRLPDVWTTYLVTPNLKLEANSIARRFGWKFAILTILIGGLLPYLWPPFGVVVCTMSFMVATTNASKVLIARAIGEEEMVALTARVFLATPPWPGLLYLVLPGVFGGAIGSSLLLYYPRQTEWGFYFGVGMLTYAFAIFVWYPAAYFRIRSKAKTQDTVHR